MYAFQPSYHFPAMEYERTPPWAETPGTLAASKARVARPYISEEHQGENLVRWRGEQGSLGIFIYLRGSDVGSDVG